MLRRGPSLLRKQLQSRIRRNLIYQPESRHAFAGLYETHSAVLVRTNYIINPTCEARTQILGHESYTQVLVVERLSQRTIRKGKLTTCVRWSTEFRFPQQERMDMQSRDHENSTQSLRHLRLERHREGFRTVSRILASGLFSSLFWRVHRRIAERRGAEPMQPLQYLKHCICKANTWLVQHFFPHFSPQIEACTTDEHRIGLVYRSVHGRISFMFWANEIYARSTVFMTERTTGLRNFTRFPGRFSRRCDGFLSQE